MNIKEEKIVNFLSSATTVILIILVAIFILVSIIAHVA